MARKTTGTKLRKHRSNTGKVAEEFEGYGSTPGKTSAKIHLLDPVALTADLPGKDLLRGQVGTVVEVLAPGVFEVEFSDDQGRAYAVAALRAKELIVLHYLPAKAC